MKKGWMVFVLLLAGVAGAMAVFPNGKPPAGNAVVGTTGASERLTTTSDSALGLTLQSGQGGSLYITGLQAGGLAERAGLRIGDHIVAIGGQTNLAISDLLSLLRGQAGQSLTVTLERAGQAQTLTLPALAEGNSAP